MSSFGSDSADFSVQLPVAEPTPSEDEMQTQLSEAGHPVDEKLAHIFIQSVTPKPLPERIRRWKARRDHLQKNGRPPQCNFHSASDTTTGSFAKNGRPLPYNFHNTGCFAGHSQQ
jgi:hypothetical protein